MKKLAAILLLGVLFFNFTGYRWMLSYMDEQATVRLEQRLDAGDYNENDLREIKIPLNLPYHNNWNDYEIYYGQVNYDGEYYQYVKRKVSNDTLYLLCLPHDEKTKINEAKNDLFRSMNDVPVDQSNNSPRATFLKLLQSEFLPIQDFCQQQAGFLGLKIKNTRAVYFTSQFFPTIPTPPPDKCTMYDVRCTTV